MSAWSGDINNPGGFLFNAFNDIEGYDDVRLDSGGVIEGARRHVDY